MQILISREIGFCSGVKRAISMAKDLLKDLSQEIYCIGPLIHNEKVIQSLAKEGLKTVNSVDDVPDFSKILTRAHGLNKELSISLINKRCIIYDSVCPKVEIIKERAIAYDNKNYKIIIYGDKKHPEIKYITSYLENYIVIKDIEDLSFFSKANAFFIVFQTTFSTNNHKEHIYLLREEANKIGKIVDIFDSICYTTLARRESCIETASLSDAVIVIGDKSSNNTVELYKTASSKCEKVFFISEPQELSKITSLLFSIKKLGIVAGASTPYELIMEVISLMDDLLNQENSKIDEVKKVVEISTQDSLAMKTEPAKESEDSTMESIFQSIPDKPRRPLKNGQIKEVIVSDTSNKDKLIISFDPMNRKNDHGYIATEELDSEGRLTPADFSLGQKFFAVIKDSQQSQTVEFSKKDFERIEKEEELVEQLKAGDDIEFTCTDVAKKVDGQKEFETGLNFKVGRYTIYAPKSQLNYTPGKKLAALVGKKVLLRILPPREGEDKKKNNKWNLYAGQKAITQETEDAFWELAVVGKVVKGTVVRYGEKDGHYFGAFVSVNGHDCLAHISELTWGRIDHPDKVLEIGKEYNFVVLESDRERNKVSLGMKQLTKQPIEIIAEKYPEGSIISGKVERIMPFGAFVSIGDGVDGLVHISQISHDRVDKVESVLEVGQTVNARIIKYDGTKVSLSIKDLLEPPTQEEIDEYKQQKRAERDHKFEKQDKPPVKKNEKKMDKQLDLDRESKPQRKPVKRSETFKDFETRDHISSQSLGATIGDTAEAKKLLLQLEQEEKNK